MSEKKSEDKKNINFLEDFLNSGLDLDDTDPRYFQIRFINGLAIAGSFFFVVFGFLNIAAEKAVLGFVEIGIAVVVLLSLYFIRKTGSLTVTVFIIAVALVGATGLLLTTGGFEETGIFWIFSFPGILMILWGFKKGVSWMLLIFSFIALLTVLNYYQLINSPYSQQSLLIFQISLLFTTSFLFIYQSIQEKNYSFIDKQRQKLEALYQVTQTEKRKVNIVLRSIGDGVLVLNKKRRIVLVNEAAIKISGYKREDLIEKNYGEKFKFVFEKDHTENTEFVDRVYDEGIISAMDKPTLLVRSDHSELAIGDSASPIKNSKGEVEGCVIVFRDVTKEREIDKMKTEFVSLASHQLKTPMTEIKLYMELLQDKATPEQQEFIDQINTSTEHMILLVSDMLNVSRMETGRKFNIVKKEISLDALLKEVIEDQAKIGEKRGVKIEFVDKAPEGWSLYVDRDKIKEVLLNLLSNAVKYSKEGGLVKTGYHVTEEKVTIYIKDDGIGIPLKQQNRIFQKLFRADNAQEKVEDGTGLGLYLARAIARAHQGDITFESAENEGTTFYLTLPINDHERKEVSELDEPPAQDVGSKQVVNRGGEENNSSVVMF